MNKDDDKGLRFYSGEIRNHENIETEEYHLTLCIGNILRCIQVMGVK
jgi:hypothetical protein